MQLSGILKELRESRRFSQKTLAARLGCSPSLVSSYETGERQPSLAMLVALADIYRVPTDYLLGRRGANPEIDLAGLSQQEIEALRVIVEAMRRN
ncbi:helix-turn-helix domain-containing protein [Yanshouia hominis]|uniref:Helix-turn-helix transcriptional regulator n=1 Tax=Yanshouia hominis TaxID=2763673 RepID=A0ABR7NFC0_9FIRM|nr:helix-turn-helix transcriptional regulator [Yanshouia hominis]MBC8575009.1 helix-turn-helix transcriptional regulator [Yanshouia hominis]